MPAIAEALENLTYMLPYELLNQFFLETEKIRNNKNMRQENLRTLSRRANLRKASGKRQKA